MAQTPGLRGKRLVSEKRELNEMLKDEQFMQEVRWQEAQSECKQTLRLFGYKFLKKFR